MMVARVARSLGVVLLVAAAACFAQPRPTPCATADHRQFDFWLGEWEVRGPAGRLAGINRIASEYDGCVVHERYETQRGYRGESLNVYDAGRQVWHQTWVDNGGLLLVLEGAFRANRMVLEGEVRGADGSRTRHRITWTPDADGSVRQLWESTNDRGEWTVAFDGRYTRRKAPQ